MCQETLLKQTSFQASTSCFWPRSKLTGIVKIFWIEPKKVLPDLLWVILRVGSRVWCSVKLKTKAILDPWKAPRLWVSDSGWVLMRCDETNFQPATQSLYHGHQVATATIKVKRNQSKSKELLDPWLYLYPGPPWPVVGSGSRPLASSLIPLYFLHCA